MTQALHLLLRQAQHARDAAQARCAQADALVQRATLQTEQLNQYREEYHQRAPARQGHGAHIELVRCHSGFMQRLEQAITQQEAQLETLREQAALQRRELIHRETHLAGLQRLAERRAGRARRDAERRDQGENDEAALRLALLRPYGLSQ